MEIFFICTVALAAALLTFVSGFGLGTLLLPAFALFFPVEVAIGMTALVHLANNLFKLFLIGKHAVKAILLKFGITSVIAAFIGATVLEVIGDDNYQIVFEIAQYHFETKLLKLIIGFVLLFFALFDILPVFKKLNLNEKHLVWGGFLSGFFGGLSGHQGALRSVFLTKLNLSKESFIATGVVIACGIDIVRISVYFVNGLTIVFSEKIVILLLAMLAAFVGSYFGKKIIKKVTIDFVQYFVALMISVFAIALILGIV